MDDAERQMNIKLATWLRAVRKAHEASFKETNDIGPYGYRIHEARYHKTVSDCIEEVIPGNPLGMILNCLFDAGYAEMWDFCNEVLGRPHEP